MRFVMFRPFLKVLNISYHSDLHNQDPHLGSMCCYNQDQMLSIYHRTKHQFVELLCLPSMKISMDLQPCNNYKEKDRFHLGHLFTKYTEVPRKSRQIYLLLVHPLDSKG